MSPTLNLTEIVGEPRTWEGKQGGKFDSYKVKADDGTVYEINVKAGNPPPKLGPDEFDVTPPKEGTSFPPKIKRQFSGGGGPRNASKDAYWEAKEQRDIEGIARMGRAHAQEMALALLTARGDLSAGSGIPVLDYAHTALRPVIDWFQQDVDASAPTTSASPASPQRSVEQHAGVGGAEGRELATPELVSQDNFASATQKNEFRSLIKAAGGSPDTVSAITMYAEAALEPARIIEAMEGLRDKANNRALAKSLAIAANEWVSRDFQPDVSDLPKAA